MGTARPNTVDLIGLQCQGLELRKLVQNRTFSIWCIRQEPSGLILARRGEEPPVWVMPEQVRTDFIALARDRGTKELSKQSKGLNPLDGGPPYEMT